MNQRDILNELKHLSITERLAIVEAAIQQIREDLAVAGTKGESREELRKRMVAAAQLLKDDYENDEELTAFTALDSEDFYEPE